LVDTIRRVRRAVGHEDDDALLEGMVEVIAAMFEGLLLRRVRNPNLDREVVVKLFQVNLMSLMSLSF